MNTTVKSYTPKPADVTRHWHLIDAKDQTLGRLATQVSVLLRGKHKPIFSPHFVTGDAVVVINAKDIKVTGNKTQAKMYRSHSQHPGGFKERTFAELNAEHPDRVIIHAVKGMLPAKSIRDQMLGMLHVYPGPDHPHAAQINASEAGHPVPAVPSKSTTPRVKKAKAAAQPASEKKEG